MSISVRIVECKIINLNYLCGKHGFHLLKGVHFSFQISMNVALGLVVTGEHVRICKEATDANVDQVSLASTARLVRIIFFFIQKDAICFTYPKQNFSICYFRDVIFLTNVDKQ